jgi:serine/threonine protein kinase
VNFDEAASKFIASDAGQFMNVSLHVRGYTNLCRCGDGAFSTVYSAIHDKTGHKVAIKVFSLTDRLDGDACIQDEIDIHRSVFHPFIIHYYGRLHGAPFPAIVLEYVNGPTLLSYLNENGPLTEREAHQIFCQLVSSVHYLHRRRLVHRDLKLENILLTLDNIVKLADFGFAYRNFGPQLAQCVTYPYAAPEILQGVPYNESIDIWSLGVILYVSVCGEFPFGCDSVSHVTYSAVNLEPNYPEFLSQEICDLFKLMFTKDPKDRVDIHGVKSHPWLQMTYLPVLAIGNAINGPLVPRNISCDLGKSNLFGCTTNSLKTHFSLESLTTEDSPITTMCRMVRWQKIQGEFAKSFRVLRVPRIESELIDSGKSVLESEDSHSFTGRSRRCSLGMLDAMTEGQLPGSSIVARRSLIQNRGRDMMLSFLRQWQMTVG